MKQALHEGNQRLHEASTCRAKGISGRTKRARAARSEHAPHEGNQRLHETSTRSTKGVSGCTKRARAARRESAAARRESAVARSLLRRRHATGAALAASLPRNQGMHRRQAQRPWATVSPSAPSLCLRCWRVSRVRANPCQIATKTQRRKGYAAAARLRDFVSLWQTSMITVFERYRG